MVREDKKVNHEPDEKEWVDKNGYFCKITRCETLGTLSAYVGVPPSHSWYNKGGYERIKPLFYDFLHWGVPVSIESLLDIHGSIMHIDILNGWNCFHFHCNHVGDLEPYKNNPSITDIYRTMEFVEGECWRLSKQLRGFQ